MATDGWKYIPTEEQEQIAVIEWVELSQSRYPDLQWLYHVPNGGLRSKRTAARLKAAGVKSGVPDLCLPVPRKGYHGLYIELKRIKGGRTSPDQDKWVDGLTDNGYFCEVCRGAESAIRTIKWYLGGAKC